jgi:RNA-directed DNA polymerase
MGKPFTWQRAAVTTNQNQKRLGRNTSMAEMQPTMEILERIKKNSKENKDEVFTRLYRYMLRPDLYYIAYKNLYANNGAATEGVNNDTADGFSEEKIIKIIDSLRNESYQPKPSRRTYRKKANGKMRPLGIPTFTDKLVQEVLRMILEAVYEPVFMDCSHGFRPNRSCHTALKDLKHQFHGTRWFIEGDIKGCFDNIDHQTLIGVIGNKVKDARLHKLIWKFLKVGYMEEWEYHSTYSGAPQGGIISPLFANIYLNDWINISVRWQKTLKSQEIQSALLNTEQLSVSDLNYLRQ